MTSDKAAAGDKAGQGRAITRGEEARVLSTLAGAWGISEANIALQWFHADGNQERLLRAGLKVGISARYTMTDDQRDRARRAGIVPGAEGWCWAPGAAVEPAPIKHLFDCPRPDLPGGERCDCASYPVSAWPEAGQPPSWLTAAVIAALPPDGQPLALTAITRATLAHHSCAGRFRMSEDIAGQVKSTLDAAVAAGEAEAVEGGQAWRRWGVPEGWGWTDADHGLSKLKQSVDRYVASADTGGRFIVYKRCDSNERIEEGTATPPTLAAARQAAIRACYERGVFGPRPAPAVVAETPQGAPSRQAYDPTRIRERLTTLLAKGPRKALDLLLDVLAIGAPEGFALPDLRANLTAIGASMVDPMGEKWGLASGGVEAPAPAPTRAEQVRLALLAVLTRGAVATRGMLLPIVEGEMGAPAGSVEPSEVRQAAREIGAEVDGPRWSLPAVPPGWGWSYYHGCTSLGCGDTRIAEVGNGHWIIGRSAPTPADNLVLFSGECTSDEEGQRQALAAARRAGLFARSVSPAVEVTGNGGPPVPPAVAALGGEAVVPQAPSPLVALARHLCGVHAYEPGSEGMRVAMASAAELTPLLAAFRADVVAETAQRMADIAKRAAEAVRAERGPLTNRQTIDASGTWRVYGDDGRTVVSEERIGDGAPAPFDGFPLAARVRIDALTADLAEAHNGYERAERDAQTWQARAVEAERDLATAIQHRDESERARVRAVDAAAVERDRATDARADLAQLQAGLDGLRTWAHGVKGASK